MKAIQLPDFTVRYDGLSFSVGWQDDTRRYHFWLTSDGTFQDEIIHSNPLVPVKQYGVNEHRSLNRTAKKWEPLTSAMMDWITDNDLLTKARVERQDKLEAEAAARRAEAEAKALKVLTQAMDAYLPEGIADQIEALSEHNRVKFVEAILDGWNAR